jgi:hypothetical protein
MCRGRPGAVFDRRELGVAGCGCGCRGSGRSPSRARRRRRSGAVEVLVLQRAEESLDDAVGLRAPDAGPDVAQRLIAGRRLVGLAAKARAVVGDDGDRSGDDVDDLAGVLVDQFEFATVVSQVVQAENAFGLVDGVILAARQYLVA